MQVDHTNTIIEANDVSFSYDGHQVLKDITLDIHKGDYLGIIGPNGGGKTTFIKVLLGLLKPQRGNITLFGKPIEAFHDWHKIGYVAQRATLVDAQFPITVGDIVLQGRIRPRSLFTHFTKEDHNAVANALEQVDLLKHKHALLATLSPGQLQRTFIARALAGNPKVIILDEPTAGVDVISQEQFYSLIAALRQKIGITLVLISHDIDVVISEATEVACINQTLVYHGNPKQFAQGNYLEKLYGKKMKFIVHGH